ncbi:unnamed protein product [Withania somnifera]
MEAKIGRDELAKSLSLRNMSRSERKASFRSVSSRSWASASVREVTFTAPGGDVFQKSTRENDDEQELKWAAIERLPTYERLRKWILRLTLEDGKINYHEVDVYNMCWSYTYMYAWNRVGIEIPKIEVRFEHLCIDGDAYVGSRALPTLWNASINFVEGFLEKIKIVPSKKRVVNILRDVNGIVNGRISYCGHELSDFIPQRTCAYISQHDVHHGEMTVRETLDFAGRCLGVGTRYELLTELSRREKDAGIKPDPEIDAFMKATAVAGQVSSLGTDYALKILGMDICADIMVGDEMRRGISGGQKKRLTTGEMLVGPAKVFFMDEISTGLDSSTTFQIVKSMRHMVHIMDVTMIISLLQPAPETYDLFDDIILLAEGKVVYQGPRQNVLEKGVADFLQEVTSLKDQEQYWFRKNEPYQYVSVAEFAERFSNFHVGQQLFDDLVVPYDKSKAYPAALVTQKYGISNMELLKACLSREWLLMKRNSFLYIFKIFQITVMSIIAFTVFFRTEMKTGQIADGGKFFGALFFSLINVMFNGTAELALTVFRLPVFFKQRDSLFYPAWAFALPIWLLRIPLSFMESLIWIVLTYYTIGFVPDASRFFCQFLVFFALHQSALSLFRFVGALGRTQVVAGTFATFTILIVFVLGGFIIAKDDLKPWMRWGYYVSPMTYGQNAIAINEFLDESSCKKNAALGDSRSVISDDDESKKKKRTEWTSASSAPMTEGILVDVRNTSSSSTEEAKKRGMVLPFQPLSLAFNHINYYVAMPAEMKAQGVNETRLQLLRDVSGDFRPGVLTALVGVSGAGKTTLMDVLAGRKTEGYIEGSIKVSGYPKNQSTFARISGYCEQNDIHSPHVTVYESLVYSAWLRLSPDVKEHTRKNFVEEIMELVELNPLRDSLIGLPGVDGLSTEQRKRLTIAVELVANPSIIFMDEPTSGLDARAAAIVMRTMRNTVDTRRTVVCTIHQPSIDIFEAFDELLLMKRGGQVIYGGPLGHHSHLLIEYFQSIPGVSGIKEGYNPATWMLDISAPTVEAQLQVDFADIYANSELYRRNQELIKELSIPAPRSQDLHFPTEYSQPFFEQCKACFWKQHLSYWRHPQYNAIRFAMTTMVGIIFGISFWNKGNQLSKLQDLLNIVGAMYAAVMFLGGTNTSAVQSIVAVERTVFYREKAAGMYSELPYAFAQVAIETIYVAIQTFVYSLILYAMIGFQWTAGKFFLFYFLFSCQIPIWWRWYYWGSPTAWTIYGLVTSQVGNMNNPIEIPGGVEVSLKLYLKDNFGFENDFLGVVAAVHVVWAVFFCFVFAYAIKFLNYQRRQK